MSNLTRCFIAIELNQQIQSQIKTLQQRITAIDLDAKWVQPENIHITLRFLGNLKDPRVKDIKDAFLDLVSDAPSFSISIGALGVFPDIQRPQTLWVGIEQGHDQVISLARNVENGLCRLGFPKEKKIFIPHLTIARLRCAKNTEKLKDFLSKETSLDSPSCPITHVSLIKSSLTPQGPVYETLKSYTLK